MINESENRNSSLLQSLSVAWGYLFVLFLLVANFAGQIPAGRTVSGSAVAVSSGVQPLPFLPGLYSLLSIAPPFAPDLFELPLDRLYQFGFSLPSWFFLTGCQLSSLLLISYSAFLVARTTSRATVVAERPMPAGWLALTFLPLCIVVMSGSLALPLSLLGLSLSVAFFERGSGFMAGLAAALCLFEPAALACLLTVGCNAVFRGRSGGSTRIAGGFLVGSMFFSALLFFSSGSDRVHSLLLLELSRLQVRLTGAAAAHSLDFSVLSTIGRLIPFHVSADCEWGHAIVGILLAAAIIVVELYTGKTLSAFFGSSEEQHCRSVYLGLLLGVVCLPLLMPVLTVREIALLALATAPACYVRWSLTCAWRVRQALLAIWFGCNGLVLLAYFGFSSVGAVLFFSLVVFAIVRVIECIRLIGEDGMSAD